MSLIRYKLGNTMIDDSIKEIQKAFYEMELRLKKYEQTKELHSIAELSTRVRIERQKQKLTLHELSDLSDVSYSSLVKLEKGEDGISLRLLKRVLRALGMELWIG